MLKSLTKGDMMREAANRRERIRAMLEENPPPSLRRIAEREGMREKAVRNILEDFGDIGAQFISRSIRSPRDETPYGLTPATANLRRKLGDMVFLIRQRGDHNGPNSIAPKIGLNFQEQPKAETGPFNHDWKLSQIERLARELGRDPRELLMSCLTG